MLTEKQFLLWFIPLAIATFVSGPLAVLHAFHPLEHIDGRAINSKTDAAQLPSYIPLLVQTEPYPATGYQTLEVDDLRLMNLTSFTAMVQSSLQSPTPALLGYVSLTRLFKQKKTFNSYPQGELLLVTKVSFSGFDDEEQEAEHLILETQHARRFQLTSVELDEETGLLFGQVEWLG